MNNSFPTKSASFKLHSNYKNELYYLLLIEFL